MSTSLEMFQAQRGQARLAELVVLDAQWLTHLMATLVTLKPNAVRKGVLRLADLEMVWREPAYPRALHPTLLALLAQFDLVHPMTVRRANDDGVIRCVFLFSHLKSEADAHTRA